MEEKMSDRFAAFSNDDSASNNEPEQTTNDIQPEVEEQKVESPEPETPVILEEAVIIKPVVETVTESEDNETDCHDQTKGLEEIKELLADLNARFESKIKYDTHKEEIIDRLHSENQSFKNDLYKKLLLPIINDLIFLLDDYSSLHKRYSEMDINEIDTAKLLKQLGSIPDDIETILYKNGIDTYTVESEKIDTARQKILKTVPTPDQEKDKTLYEVLKKGFIWEGRIIRMENISCYKYEKTNE